jgi:hypothetical protein
MAAEQRRREISPPPPSRDQFVAIMFELLVADAGDATELLEFLASFPCEPAPASFEAPVDRIRRIAIYSISCHKIFFRL